MSLEKGCFDKFITHPCGSCLLIVRCNFLKLPLFVEWNSLLLFWCWIVFGPRCWRPLAGFFNGHFDRLSWSLCFWVHHFGFVWIVLFLSWVLQFLLLVVLLVRFLSVVSFGVASCWWFSTCSFSLVEVQKLDFFSQLVLALHLINRLHLFFY